ncbi:MAG: DUF4190 domain-containing protein [Candidatus Microsaccharimonas sp.]
MAENVQNLKKGLATTSLILGITSLVLALLWPIAFIAGTLAIIFGIIALSNIKKGVGTGKNLAVTGIITGSIAVVVAIILVLITIFVLPSTQGDLRDTTRRQDLATLDDKIAEYRAANGREFPAVQDIDLSELKIVKELGTEGEPTGSKAIIKFGETCAGVMAKATYSTHILLENGEHYCGGY